MPHSGQRAPQWRNRQSFWKLYKLNLAGNRLSTIPTPLIVQLTGLRVLDLSQCDLYTLPERWDLPSLKKLILSHNRIQTCFPEVRDIYVCLSSRQVCL